MNDLIIHTNDAPEEEVNETPIASSSSSSNTTLLLEDTFHTTTKKTLETFEKREILLKAIKEYNFLSSISFSLFGSSGVQQKDWEYRQLSKEFLNDKQVVVEGLKKVVYKYSELNDELKRDWEVILASVKGDPIDGFELVPEDLRADRELVSKVMELSAFSLKFVSAELRNDPEIVWKAVCTSGLALQFASDELKRDRNLAIKAIKGRSHVIEYIDSDIIESIISDRKCLEDILSENPDALHDFIFHPKCAHILKLASDKDLFKIAIKNSDEPNKFFHLMAQELKEDKEFILEILDITKGIYKYLNNDLQNDSDIKQKVGL